MSSENPPRPPESRPAPAPMTREQRTASIAKLTPDQKSRIASGKARLEDFLKPPPSPVVPRPPIVSRPPSVASTIIPQHPEVTVPPSPPVRAEAGAITPPVVSAPAVESAPLRPPIVATPTVEPSRNVDLSAYPLAEKAFKELTAPDTFGIDITPTTKVEDILSLVTNPIVFEGTGKNPWVDDPAGNTRKFIQGAIEYAKALEAARAQKESTEAEQAEETAESPTAPTTGAPRASGSAQIEFEPIGKFEPIGELAAEPENILGLSSATINELAQKNPTLLRQLLDQRLASRPVETTAPPATPAAGEPSTPSTTPEAPIEEVSETPQQPRMTREQRTAVLARLSPKRKALIASGKAHLEDLMDQLDQPDPELPPPAVEVVPEPEITSAQPGGVAVEAEGAGQSEDEIRGVSWENADGQTQDDFLASLAPRSFAPGSKAQRLFIERLSEIIDTGQLKVKTGQLDAFNEFMALKDLFKLNVETNEKKTEIRIKGHPSLAKKGFLGRGEVKADPNFKYPVIPQDIVDQVIRQPRVRLTPAPSGTVSPRAAHAAAVSQELRRIDSTGRWADTWDTMTGRTPDTSATPRRTNPDAITTPISPALVPGNRLSSTQLDNSLRKSGITEDMIHRERSRLLSQGYIRDGGYDSKGQQMYEIQDSISSAFGQPEPRTSSPSASSTRTPEPSRFSRARGAITRRIPGRGAPESTGTPPTEPPPAPSQPRIRKLTPAPGSTPSPTDRGSTTPLPGTERKTGSRPAEPSILSTYLQESLKPGYRFTIHGLEAELRDGGITEDRIVRERNRLIAEGHIQTRGLENGIEVFEVTDSISRAFGQPEPRTSSPSASRPIIPFGEDNTIVTSGSIPSPDFLATGPDAPPIHAGIVLPPSASSTRTPEPSRFTRARGAITRRIPGRSAPESTGTPSTEPPPADVGELTKEQVESYIADAAKMGLDEETATNAIVVLRAATLKRNNPSLTEEDAKNLALRELKSIY